MLSHRSDTSIGESPVCHDINPNDERAHRRSIDAVRPDPSNGTLSCLHPGGLAHSLCEDEAALDALAGGGWFATRKDGVESVERRLPNEEVLESLAARVRPLMLHDDGLHYSTVLNALSEYLAKHGQTGEAKWCRTLKKDWQSVDIKGGEPGYFLSVKAEGSGEPASEMTDVALAGSWFYGDLVHADQDRIDAGAPFEIENRFAAAAVRTAQLSILTRDTYAFIGHLIDEGLLKVDGDTLDQVPVKVESKSYSDVKIYTAPTGTAMPGVAGEDLDDAWTIGTAFPGTEDGEWAIEIPRGRID